MLCRHDELLASGETYSQMWHDQQHNSSNEDIGGDTGVSKGVCSVTPAMQNVPTPNAPSENGTTLSTTEQGGAAWQTILPQRVDTLDTDGKESKRQTKTTPPQCPGISKADLEGANLGSPSIENEASSLGSISVEKKGSRIGPLPIKEGSSIGALPTEKEGSNLGPLSIEKGSSLGLLPMEEGSGLGALSTEKQGSSLGSLSVEEWSSLGSISIEKGYSLGVLPIEKGSSLGALSVEKDGATLGALPREKKQRPTNVLAAVKETERQPELKNHLISGEKTHNHNTSHGERRDTRSVMDRRQDQRCTVPVTKALHHEHSENCLGRPKKKSHFGLENLQNPIEIVPPDSLERHLSVSGGYSIA